MMAFNGPKRKGRRVNPAMMVAGLLIALGIAGVLLAGIAPARPVQASTAQHSASIPACDPNWLIVASPITPTYAVLKGIEVVSANDIWAVGGNIDSVSTLHQHWDGTSWSVVDGPNLVANDMILNEVSVVSANDVWAVGTYQIISSAEFQTLIEHGDGTSWSVVPSPNVTAYLNSLEGVEAISANDVWAVGTYQTASSNQTLVEHWNGSEWSVVTSPNPPSANNGLLNDVEAVSASDVWAVGSSTDGTLVEHWNGSEWSIVTSPSVGTNSVLYDVDVVSASDVWAVGRYYNGSFDRTLIEHWDGIGWSVITSPNVGTFQNSLFGVEAISANNVWAVGIYGTGGPSQTLVEHWNGTSWSVVTSPSLGQSNLLHGIAAVNANDIWAVGYHAESTNQSLTIRYNPCTPSPTPTVAVTPTVCAVDFPDVPAGSTFYDYVRCLACRGIVSGLPDGTFGPNNPVTRGQLAKIISNAAGYNEPGSGQTFEDVAVGSTFYEFVERLASRSVIGGYACGGAGEPCGTGNLSYFRPNGNATRGQLAKIVCRAYGCMGMVSGQTFEDVTPANTFYEDIEHLYALGSINGYACGSAGEPCVGPGNRPYFRPGNSVTRGQTSKIVSSTFFPGCDVGGR